METKKLFTETYGCRINAADSEVVAAILREKNYNLAEKADIISLNTCPVRNNAEKRIWGQPGFFNRYKNKNNGKVNR